MEGIIGRLLTADNTLINQATAELKEVLKSESAIEELWGVVVSSASCQIRQYAAVILRQRLKKFRNWSLLSAHIREKLCQDILKVLVTEQEHIVLKAIVLLTGAVAKHDLQSVSWLRLFDSLGQMCILSSPEDFSQKERGLFILSSLSESCPDLFPSVVSNTVAVVAKTLQSVQDTRSPLIPYSLMILKNLAEHFCDNESIRDCYIVILPVLLRLLKTLLDTDEEITCNLLEMLDSMVETSVISTMQGITPIANVAMQLASSSNKQIQLKALCVLDTVVKMKKKAIIKNNLLLPILQCVVEVIQMPSEVDLDYENANETNSPVLYASQVLDGIALNLPPGKIMPYILQTVQHFSTTQNPYQKKAAYIIIAVTAEGCAEFICNKCFNIYLELVCKGLKDSSLSVKDAALYSLGQFSQHLQPEIGKHSEELMPTLLKLLENIINTKNQLSNTHVERVFYALETFIENSEKETFLPYLPSLIENLLSLVSTDGSSVHLKELAMRTVSACATTAQDCVSPFLHRVVNCLSVFLINTLSKDQQCLQIQAIETLAALARAVPPENFQQVAHDCIRYGYTILENQSDPEVEGSIYDLFGAASVVLKDGMADIMGPVITKMLKTMESNEGIVVHYDEENSGLPDCGDLSDSLDEIDLEATSEEDDDDDDEDKDVTGYSVENVYLDKKAAACYAIKELALNTGDSFLPFLPSCSNATLKLLEYPHEAVKRAALDALSQLCVNCIVSSNVVDKNDLANVVSIFIQKCSEIIHTDEERDVVSQALESYAYLLKSSKELIFKHNEQQEAIFNCICDVFHKQTHCQLEDEDSSIEDENAEQDELLIEYAGDILPYFGRAMPADEFKGYFIIVLPFLKSKIVPSGTVAERSFGIGILAECMEPLAPVLHEFSNELLPAFVKCVRDEHGDVRNNAVYGLGEMIYHGKDRFFVHYGEVLALLSQCLSGETVPKVIDNICGAVARMILANSNLVPLNQVFPVLMNCIPLKKDYKENSTMIKCFHYLYEGGYDVLTQYLDKIILYIVYIVHHKQGEDDALMMAKNLFAFMLRDFPNQVSAVRIGSDLMHTYTKLMNT